MILKEIRLHKYKTGLSFRRLIGMGMAAKLVVDIGSQIFNPFLLAVGLLAMSFVFGAMPGGHRPAAVPLEDTIPAESATAKARGTLAARSIMQQPASRWTGLY